MLPTLDTANADPPGAPSAHRFAVLGLGRAGLAWAMAVAQQPACALAGFVEPRGALRRFARGAGFTAPAFGSLEQLLAKQPCDAVIVAAPLGERVALVESAVRAGLAVLVDGLPVTHAEGAARLAGALAGATAPVACGIGLLFHPLLARAVSVVGAGGIGAPREIRASVYVSRVFAAGSPPEEGDVLDFAVGELLVVLDAMFGPPVRVTATGQRLFGARLDEVHAQLELPGGRQAGVDGSWSVPGYPRASLVIEVVGERGALLVSDDALETDLSAACEGLPAGHSRRVLADELDPVAFESGEATRSLAAFVSTLQAGPMLDALDPRRALRVARSVDAMRRSAADGGRPVEAGE